MSLFNFLIRQYLKARWARIFKAIEQPSETQHAIFHSLILQAKHTAWGKTYQYEKIKTITDFQAVVPLSDYDDLKPWIEKIQLGEQNVLWPQPVKWMAKSSGTTADKSKYIPLPSASIFDNHIKGGKDFMAMYYYQFSNANIFSGKSVVLGGSLSDTFENYIQAGDLSGILVHQVPEWLQVFRTPARHVVTIADWEKKLEVMSSQLQHENVTSITGVPAWMLQLLTRVLAKSGKKKIAEVWPNLELIVHGGVDFLPYKTQFEQMVGKPIHYVNAYNASEGFFAFQDSDVLGMLLHPGCGIFYEFIAWEDYEQNNHAITLSEVRLNQKYVIVISTNGGLWRYVVGDLVEFTSLQPFRLNVVGRTKQCINMFGEELMVHNAELALANTCEALKCSVKEYTVAPRMEASKSSGWHEWVIEFTATPKSLEEFVVCLDNQLKLLNSDYEAKRKNDLMLKPLQVFSLKGGTFYHYMTKRQKVGGQHKVPRLQNSTDWVDELKLGITD